MTFLHCKYSASLSTLISLLLRFSLVWVSSHTGIWGIELVVNLAEPVRREPLRELIIQPSPEFSRQGWQLTTVMKFQMVYKYHRVLNLWHSLYIKRCLNNASWTKTSAHCRSSSGSDEHSCEYWGMSDALYCRGTSVHTSDRDRLQPTLSWWRGYGNCSEHELDPDSRAGHDGYLRYCGVKYEVKWTVRPLP